MAFLGIDTWEDVATGRLGRPSHSKLFANGAAVQSGLAALKITAPAPVSDICRPSPTTARPEHAVAKFLHLDSLRWTAEVKGGAAHDGIASVLADSCTSCQQRK